MLPPTDILSPAACGQVDGRSSDLVVDIQEYERKIRDIQKETQSVEESLETSRAAMGHAVERRDQHYG